MQREDRVALPQRVHAAGIFGFREVAAQVPFAQAPNLVLVEVADKIAHQAGTRAIGRAYAVPEQLLEDVGAVVEPLGVIHPASL